MKRRVVVILVCALIAWSGYQMWAERGPVAPRRPVDAQKPMDTPKVLDKSQLEATLREKYDLETVSLEEGEPGRFTGTGRGRQGKAYRFQVTQGEKSRNVIAKWDDPNAPAGVAEEHSGLRW